MCIRDRAFGIVLLEAAAASTAVIGTRVGGIPEAMSEGENGFIVDYNKPEDLSKSILHLLNDDKLRLEMGISGRNFAEGFSWSKIIDELDKEYQKLLA